MSLLHRNDDARTCGALTVVTNQTTFFAANELVAVVGDNNSHGGGAFTNNSRTFYIGGKKVIGVTDPAAPDNLCPDPGGQHCTPNAATGLSTFHIGY